MKRALLSLFAVALHAAAQPAITSDAQPPVVLQGSTHQFAATCSGGCTYSLAPGSAGTIDANGLYHAPAKVTVNQSIYGCQVLPPDSAFNAPVDTLPVRPESAAWVQLLIGGGRALHMVPHDVPTNVISGGTPSHPFSFLYTAANNGNYQVPDMPDLELQSGYYYSQADRHYFGVRPDTCTVTEIYNSSANLPSYDIFPNSSSGLSYRSMTGALPAHGATNAAGNYMLPNTLRAQEVMKALATGATVIPHVISVTLKNYSQLGSTVPEWPATTVAVNGTGTIPYGARFRLKSSYVYSGTNPVTAILINTMKQYGFMAADGGFSMDTYGLDTDTMPPQMASALAEIRNLFPAGALNNFEFVKQAGLAPAVKTGPEGGLIDPAAASAIAGYAAPQYAQVIVTDSTGSARMRVLLQGPAVDFERSMYAFQAGAGPLALPYHISGLSDLSVTCTMSPAIGTLDVPTCTYTPPRALAAPTMTAVTITSNADPAVKTQTNILVLPDGDLGLLPAAPSDYTDAGGRQWWAVSPNSSFPLASYGTMLNTVPYQDAPTTIPDYRLYGYGYHPRGDIGLDLRVAPGQYKITVKQLSQATHGWQYLEAQGQAIYPWLDLYSLAGGKVDRADLVMPALAGSDGRLRIYARRTDQYNTATASGWPAVRGTDTATQLGAVLIQADPLGTPHISVSPAAPASITPGQTQKFTCIGWYMANTCTWAVTSGPGTIDANGLYMAPSTPYDPDVQVTVTATSTADHTKTATATLTLTFGTIAVTPAASSTDRGMTVNFAAAINGIGYSKVAWSMSPSIGALDSASGAYTAPDSLSSDTTVTITATSTDNAAHLGSTTLLVRANPLPIYLAPGIGYLGGGLPGITDSAGVLWSDAGMSAGHPLYYSCVGGQCYGVDNNINTGIPASSATYPPIAEVSSVTQRIWQGVIRGSAYSAPPQSDFTFTFPVPNGAYEVALGFNTSKVPSTVLPPDYPNGIQSVSINGAPWLTSWSTLANCGINVACSPPPATVTVTGRQIELRFHGANPGNWPAGSGTYYPPQVNLIRIRPVVAAFPPPVCNAGPRKTVRAGYAAQLDGSASQAQGGSGLKYRWHQLSGPSRARWSSRAAASPSITGLIAGSYVFQLTVEDSSGQSSSCTVETGAVATDDNGVAITNNPALDLLLGPLVRLGANPWPWFDDRALAAADLQIAGMDANYPAWWDAAAPGTVTVTAGSNAVVGDGTAFSTTFCQGPASPAAPKSGAMIAIWYKTGTAGVTGRRMSAVTGCVDDTHLTVDVAWDSGVIPAGPGLSYAADDSSTHYASNWGWENADSPGNYYDNVAAYYALHARSGLDKYLAAARKLADRVWRSPMVDRGASETTGHGGGYGYTGRALSALGLVLRAVELQGTASDMWPGLHQIWDAYLDALAGTDPANGPGMWDTEEEAYHLAMVSYCALLDPDAAYRSRCKAGIANSLAALWTPSMSPDGSWPQLYYDSASWETGSSAVLTNGSTSVVGSGTSWTAEDFPGTIWFTNAPAARPPNNSAGDAAAYTAAFVDATHLLLDRPYQGTTGVHGWALAGGAAMVGWGARPGFMGLLAAAFDLAGKAIADSDPANASLARGYGVQAARWIRTNGYWPLEKGMYAGAGGINCAAPIADGNTACTGGNTAGQARALSAAALHGIMAAYGYTRDSALRDLADTLYNAMFAKPGTCPDGSQACLPDGKYVEGLDGGGEMMTAGPPAGNAWFGKFFGFDNLAAWPAYRAGGLQASNPQTGYIAFNLDGVRGATKVRVMVTAPSGKTTELECSASPCAVTLDGKQGKHLIRTQYLSDAGAVLATTELPI